MEKQKITREGIHIISRHSNWQADDAETMLKEQGIYAGPQQWSRFLNLILPGMGASLALAGIIFFFAYNWASMHKFVKMGIVEISLAACIILSLLPKLPPIAKNIALTAASVLVGALFAVFGQIYQTGADAYDFFLGWTVFVSIWVLISGFAPLWMVGLVLVNTTICLYAEQVAEHWSGPTVFNILFLINAGAVVICELFTRDGETGKRPLWFIQTAALAAIAIITTAIVISIFEYEDAASAIAFLFGLIGLGGGLAYGFLSRSIFYISTVAFSAIVIVSALIIKPIHDPVGVFLFVSLFVVGSTTGLIFQLIALNKKWHGNQQPD